MLYWHQSLWCVRGWGFCCCLNHVSGTVSTSSHVCLWSVVLKSRVAQESISFSFTRDLCHFQLLEISGVQYLPDRIFLHVWISDPYDGPVCLPGNKVKPLLDQTACVFCLPRKFWVTDSFTLPAPVPYTCLPNPPPLSFPWNSTCFISSSFPWPLLPTLQGQNLFSTCILSPSTVMCQ